MLQSILLLASLMGIFPLSPPPNLPIAALPSFLKSKKTRLVDLLNKKGLIVPMMALCQSHSPLYSLYLAYREISIFIQSNQQPLAHPSGPISNREHIISTLHQLGALEILTELDALPATHVTNSPDHEAFCSCCYKKGHRFINCQFRKCNYCDQWNPRHTDFGCPLRRAHVLRRNPNTATTASAFYPTYPPGTLASPTPSHTTPSSSRSTPTPSKRQTNHRRNNQRGRRNHSAQPRPRPPTRDQIADFTQDALDGEYEFDDNAMSNMCDEPVGNDDY